MAAEIVAAFVSHNSVPPGEVPSLIELVYATLSGLGATVNSDRREERARRDGDIARARPLAPAVSIPRSITPEYLICLDDGKRFKTLRRHLTSLGMTPQQYRMKWGLPASYPMVAPNYSARRSDMAKSIGLGQIRGESITEAARPTARRKRGQPNRPTK